MFRYWFQIDLFHQTQVFPLQMTCSAHIPIHSDPCEVGVLNQYTAIVSGPVIDVYHTTLVSAILAAWVVQPERSPDIDGANKTNCVSNGQNVNEIG